MLQILSSNNYFAVYLQPFHNLKSLELHTSFNKNNVLGLACLFRSSPTLHTLILKIINDYKMERRVSFIHYFELICSICNIIKTSTLTDFMITCFH